ncbi:MAG: type IV pilus assembly protein PilM [Actinobacteria bacterium]|nr:type IV pilus assembly protein PilM [Actinomycetota bacterium]
MSEQQSIWKKEISFGRRKEESAPVAVAEPEQPKQSIWKKEFHIGGVPTDHPSFWKKEIRLLAPRKPPVVAAPAPAVAPVAEPATEPVELDRPAWLQSVPAERPAWLPPKEAEAPSSVSDTVPVSDTQERAAPARAVAPVAEPATEPVELDRPAWLQSVPAERPAWLPPKEAEASSSVSDTVPVSDTQERVTWRPPKREETWVEPEPAPAPTPAPVIYVPEPLEHLKKIFAPQMDRTLVEVDARLEAARAAVRAALAAPLPDGTAAEPAPAKEPFWKKELSVKRAPKRVVEKQPSVPFWKKDLSFKRAPKPVVEKEASVPFWKKELSFKRAPKPVEEKQPSVPFWERELSFSRGPKADKKLAEKREFWKRELAFRKSPKQAKPDAPNVPFWKREIGRSNKTASAGHAATKLVGLRIGSSQLAAAVVDNNGSTTLLQLARADIAPGVVESGEVRDTAALARALKKFFAQHKLPRKGVRLGVATNRIGVRVIEMPAIDDPKLLANAVRFRAQEVLPFPLTDAVLDHVVLASEDPKQLRVLIVFAHRELVDGYAEACKKAGLKLHGVDFDAFALLRALTNPPETDKRAAIVAVSIGHERTIFAVSDGEVCDFARVLEWGGAALDEAIATALETTPAEAAEMKKSLSLGSSDPEFTKVRAAVRDELQTLTRELVSSLQFYQSRPGSLDIGELLLTGGVANLEGLADELARQLGVPVRVGDPLHRVTVGKSLRTPEQLGSLAIAVGLGIES